MLPLTTFYKKREQARMAKVKYLGTEQSFRYMGHITGKDYYLHNNLFVEVDDLDAADMEGGNFEVDYGVVKKVVKKVKSKLKIKDKEVDDGV